MQNKTQRTPRFISYKTFLQVTLKVPQKKRFRPNIIQNKPSKSTRAPVLSNLSLCPAEIHVILTTPPQGQRVPTPDTPARYGTANFGQLYLRYDTCCFDLLISLHQLLLVITCVFGMGLQLFWGINWGVLKNNVIFNSMQETVQDLYVYSQH